MTTFENASKEQVENFVTQWFTEEGYELNSHSDPNSSFNYSVTRPNSDIKFNVGQHKDSKDSIMIIGVFNPNEQEQKMLKYLKIKRQVMWELKRVYTLVNVGFSLTSKATEEDFTLENLSLHKTIYYEALTKQTFHDALNSVFNCLKFTRDTFLLFGQSSTNNLTQ
jgi:hypothetical protein